MADLSNIQGGEILTLRIYKRLSTNPTIEWANTYEFVSVGQEQTEAQLRGLALQYAVEEALLHLEDVVYTRAVLSSWIPDGQPYNPNSFLVVDLAGVDGARAPGTDPLPLQMCFQVKRDVSFGRAGRSLYRRVLTEADVNAPAGSPVIRDQDVLFYTAAVEALWLAHSTAAASANMRQALVSNSGEPNNQYIREVNGLGAVRSVTVKKFNNRYYDLAAR